MDFSYIFNSSLPDYNSFKNFGFTKDGGTYICKKELPDCGFYTILKVENDKLTAEVFEKSTDEKYALVDVKAAGGAFVSKIREEVQKIAEDFRSQCFLTNDLHEKYLDFLEKEFNCKAEYPWADAKRENLSDSAVFRCPNQKWFALIMNITYKNLGFESEEKVRAVNLKADTELLDEIVDKKSVFPAYHMNKKHWITVLLTAVTDFEKLKKLTQRSYELVMAKK